MEFGRHELMSRIEKRARPFEGQVNVPCPSDGAAEGGEKNRSVAQKNARWRRDPRYAPNDK
jgi:hypothetical protein